MKHIERIPISVTTDASGDGTGYSKAVSGRILGVEYTKNNFDDTVDFTMTTETTGLAILAISNRTTSGAWTPWPPVQDETGADATYDGTRKVRGPRVVVNERIKVVVAQGGNVKSGTYNVLVG